MTPELVRPMHELRGALAALDLGLSLVERSSRSDGERTAGLRLQLGRACKALKEIDAVRDGKAPGPRGDIGLFDLTPSVAAHAIAWAQLAPGYGAALRLAWHAGPVWVRGDRECVMRALDNLIANALEHGGGRVLVESELQEWSVRITISDDGRGLPVPPGDLAQAGPASIHGHGLAIARDAVQAHGGTITSGVSMGRAAVVVDLPLEPSTPEELARPVPAATAA